MRVMTCANLQPTACALSPHTPSALARYIGARLLYSAPMLKKRTFAHNRAHWRN